MANLIITVIAIVLVAVASLMGAYYGGQAFLEGSDKARATALVNQASQVSGAIDLYTINEAGSPLTFSNLINGVSGGDPYLSERPLPPDGAAVEAGNSTWSFVELTAVGTTLPDSTTIGANSNVGVAIQVTEEVCTRINENAGYTRGNDNNMLTGTDNLTNMRYGCDGTTGTHYVVYRVR